jgi:hypothetical protein
MASRKRSSISTVKVLALAVSLQSLSHPESFNNRGRHAIRGVVRAQVGDGPNGCWTNTSEIFLDLKNRTEFEEKVYRLCPGREFNIVVKDESGRKLNGTDPLLAASNVKYICGLDGDPDDNCVLRNGEEQIYSLGQADDTFTENVQFIGLTFTGETRTIASFFKPGTVLFSRCRFQVRSQYPCLQPASPAVSLPVYARLLFALTQSTRQNITTRNSIVGFIQAPPGTGSRQLRPVEISSSAEEQSHGSLPSRDDSKPALPLLHRRLEDLPDVERLSITFSDCIFEGISVTNPDVPLPSYGIIMAPASKTDLLINGSLFQNNEFRSPSPGVSFMQL